MKEIEKEKAIRITDLGAVTAIYMARDTLLHIILVENMYKVRTLSELKEELKRELRRYIIWIEKRERDGTLLGKYTKKELNKLVKMTRQAISWGNVPPKKDLDSLKMEKKELLSLNNQVRPKIKKIKILMDTSFLLSYVLKDQNYLAVAALVGYLKPQHQYFDLYIPNFVFFELISKLKKHYRFSKAKEMIDHLFDDINSKNVYVGGIELSMLETYERYKLFSRKKISSILKGNDFMIATEGITSEALILTCDKQFYKNCRKIYKGTYLVVLDNTNDNSKFIKKFEKERENNMMKK